MLFSPTSLNPTEAEVLDRVLKLRQQLSLSTAPQRWSGLLRRSTLARAIQGSNSIEGYFVTVDDAIAAVEGEEPFDPKTESWLATVGYRRAMTLVLQKAGAPHFEYSSEFINSLHFMMVEHDLAKYPGNWRSRTVFVVDERTKEAVYEAPGAAKIPQLMAELVAALNEDEDGMDLIVTAAMAHLNLVMIHPYADGNGRMARCLQTLVLARSGTAHPALASIEEYLGHNTRDYYQVLAEVGGGSWQPSRDTKPWLRFSLTAHFRQATTLLQRSRFFADVFDESEGLAVRHKLDVRVAYALVDAATGLKVRNATYRSMADISQKTATRDLNDLVQAGLLLKHGRRKGAYYVASETLTKALAKIAKPGRVADPFDG